MLNKLREFIRQYQLLNPGDHVVCAVSGGADSVALLFALYLLRESLKITLEAAHFNHGLRGDESDRDEAFVRQLCHRLDIPLSVGQGKITAGKKGLEAAARDARYAFLETISGKIATAHTADDNAETVLMHLVRGTGLKGLGGISPVNDRLIRPMLSVTRHEVEKFLDEFNLTFVTDSSNNTDCFMRNRLRHHVMPLLQQENPRLAENLSAMALRLREDEQVLSALSLTDSLPQVSALREMPQALRSRCVAAFLQKQGMKEPEAAHIALVDNLIFSENPSARLILSETVQVSRQYDRLVCTAEMPTIVPLELACPGEWVVPELDLKIQCLPAEKQVNDAFAFTVTPKGKMNLRSRQPGDAIRLPGGTKTLKKLFIDRKIPAASRCRVPVIADDTGVLGVYGIGANLDRLSASDGSVEIRFVSMKEER